MYLILHCNYNMNEYVPLSSQKHFKPLEKQNCLRPFTTGQADMQSLMWRVVLRMTGEMNGSVIRGNYLWSLIRRNLFRENACCLSTCRRKPAADEKDHWRLTLQFKFMLAWWHTRVVSFDGLYLILSDPNAYSELYFAISVNWNIDVF